MQRSDQEVEPVWPPAQVKPEAFLCSAANQQDGFHCTFFFYFYYYFFFFFTGCPKAEQLLLTRQQKLACRTRHTLVYLRSSIFQTAPVHRLHQPAFRWSTDAPMAPFLTVHRDPVRAAPGAPRRSSWHRRIVAVGPSSSELSGWSVGTHPASDYSWIPPSSVGSDHYLPFFLLLWISTRVNFTLWQ